MVTITEAKATLNALLAEVERTGASVAITKRGRPVAVLMPAQQRTRRFGQLSAHAVADTFDIRFRTRIPRRGKVIRNSAGQHVDATRNRLG